MTILNIQALRADGMSLLCFFVSNKWIIGSKCCCAAQLNGIF